MAWDPKTYLTFGAERTRPAAEFLARVVLDAPAKVVDLGCGPGNSTALMAARWPDADLEGVDSSPEMLEEAKRSGVKARWSQADIANWNPSAKYDVIFSNATFQWLSDHKALLPRLMAQVSDGGAFAFQMPRNFRDPSHALIREAAEAGPWSAKLKNLRDWWNVLEPEAYFDILEPYRARHRHLGDDLCASARRRRCRLSLGERHGIAAFRKCAGRTGA